MTTRAMYGLIITFLGCCISSLLSAQVMLSGEVRQGIVYEYGIGTNNLFNSLVLNADYSIFRVSAGANYQRFDSPDYWIGESPSLRSFALSAGLHYEWSNFEVAFLGGAFYGDNDSRYFFPYVVAQPYDFAARNPPDENDLSYGIPSYLSTRRIENQGIYGVVLHGSLAYRFADAWQAGVSLTSYEYIIGRRISYRPPVRGAQLFLRYSIPGSGEKLSSIPIVTALYGGVVLNQTDGWWTTAQATLRFKNVLVAADVDLMRHDLMNTSYYKSYDYAGSFNGAALSLGYALDVQRFTFGLTAGYFYGFGRMKQSHELSADVERTVYYDEDVFGLRARLMIDYRVTDRWSAGVSAVANAYTTHQPMFIASAQLPTPAAIQIGVKHNWGKLNHQSVQKPPTP